MQVAHRFMLIFTTILVFFVNLADGVQGVSILMQFKLLIRQQACHTTPQAVVVLANARILKTNACQIEFTVYESWRDPKKHWTALEIPHLHRDLIFELSATGKAAEVIKLQ